MHPLARPWDGSPDQRRAYHRLKERERIARCKAAIEAKEQRAAARAAKIKAERKRQEQRRLASEAQARAERIAQFAGESFPDGRGQAGRVTRPSCAPEAPRDEG